MTEKRHPGEYVIIGCIALFLVAISPVLLPLYGLGRLVERLATRLGMGLD